MRSAQRFWPVSIAIILSCAPSVRAADTVAITEYMNSTNAGAKAGEWVELYNYGSAPVSISGWKLKDDTSLGVTLPEATIAAHDFLILARDKAAFEQMWLVKGAANGAASAKVVQWPSGFSMADSKADEIVLNNASGALVWRLAYGANSNKGSSTYFALDDFSVNNYGTTTSVINRNGPDPLTGTLGYEGQEFRHEAWAYSGGGDVGSPLRGAYTGAMNPPAQPTNWTLDVSGAGTTLSAGVRGLAIADEALTRHDNADRTGVIPCVITAEGSAIRGVSGGLNADIYDWKTRNAEPRPTTLEHMRFARDYREELYITANIRGLTVPDATSPTTHRMYYTSDTATLAKLAADWVRYTNHIVQTYHQGDTITDPRDAAIVAALTWSSSFKNEFGTADKFTTLTASTEAPVAPVRYWEIGNEPLISLAHAYSVTNAFTFSGKPGNSTYADYANRYIAITTAMLAEDPAIKVGPCVVSARAGGNADILATLLQSGARIDFISYHPYGSMGQYPNAPLWQEAYLGGVYSEQAVFLKEIKDLVAAYRPSQANSMEYVASETNVSDWPVNNVVQEGTMAHALGSAESVLSWGRLGLRAAHYWIWITATSSTQLSDWNRFPVTMVFEKLRDKLGDRLLGAFDSNDKVHMYAVRTSATGELCIWAMNFSHTTDIPVHLSLTGAPDARHARVKRQVLQALGGPTNLFSANLPPELNHGVPRRDVDWSASTVISGANPAALDLTLPAATLTLITMETVAPASMAQRTAAH